jgi:hypothetical protein
MITKAERQRRARQSTRDKARHQEELRQLEVLRRRHQSQQGIASNWPRGVYPSHSSSQEAEALVEPHHTHEMGLFGQMDQTTVTRAPVSITPQIWHDANLKAAPSFSPCFQ